MSKTKREGNLADRKDAARRQHTQEAQALYHRYIDFALGIRNGEPTGKRYPTLFIGPAGYGKTSAAVAYITETLGYDVVYLPASQLSPEDLFVPVPFDASGEGMDWRLRRMLHQKLTSPNPKVVFIDEMGRSSKRTQAALLTLIQEGVLGGVEVPNLIGVIAADNPAEYSGVNSREFALASRFVVKFLEPNDIPWREHLADKYAHRDLRPLFAVWDSLHPKVRDQVPPRLLDFMIDNADNGIPLRWTLPIYDRTNTEIFGPDGNDITREVIGKLEEALGATGFEGRTFDDKLRFLIDQATSRRVNLRIVGDAGTAKTAVTLSHLAEKGYEVIHLPLAQISTEDMVVPVPVNGKLLSLLDEAFLTESPKVIVIDEYRRAEGPVKNAALELIQERSLSGVKVPGLVSVIVIDNPNSTGDIRYEVGELDPAHATRFAINATITSEDTPWAEYLLTKYGKVAEPFIDWRSERLGEDPTLLTIVSPRVLELMIGLFEAGLNIEDALPVLDDDQRAEVSLHHLRGMLAGFDIPSLSRVLDNAETYAAQIRGGDRNIETVVLDLFRGAELARLDQPEIRPQILTLVAALNRTSALSLLTKGGESQAFWRDVLLEVNRQAVSA